MPLGTASALLHVFRAPGTRSEVSHSRTPATRQPPPPATPPSLAAMLRSPALAAQHFAGSPLVRGAAGRKLDHILAGGSSSDGVAWFCLVADRRVAVSDGGGSASSPTTAVRWLDRDGLAANGISYPGTGEELSLGGGQPAPVYFLGAEERPRRALRLAVDLSAAPPTWAEQRGVRLKVGVMRGQVDVRCLYY